MTGDTTTAATVEPQAQEQVQHQGQADPPGVETVEVGSVSNLVELVLARHDGTQPMWFRGQARSTWRLEPSLIRKGGLKHERVFRDEFERDAYPQLARVQFTGGGPNEWDWLFLQQHYRVPTRLMDWTEEPLVAAFFALDETDVTDEAGDAAVWALRPQQLNKLSSIRVPNTWSVPMCGRSAEVEYFTLEQITANTDRELYPMAAMATRRFDRIIAQAGTFTVAHPSHPEPLEELVPQCLVKFVLPAGVKEEMGEQLERLGVTVSSIYPDLEHLGRRIGGRLP